MDASSATHHATRSYIRQGEVCVVREGCMLCCNFTRLARFSTHSHPAGTVGNGGRRGLHSENIAGGRCGCGQEQVCE